MSVNPESLVDRIYEAALFPEAWSSVLHDIAGHADAAGTTLILRGAGAPISWTMSPAMAVIGDGFMTSGGQLQSQTTPRLLAANRAGFVADHEIFDSDEEFLADPLMAQWGTQAGMHRAAATAIQVPGGDFAIFHLQRYIGRPKFDPASLARLDGLRPHLARSAMLAARWRLERLRAAAQALELIGIPAAILDADGRVLIANALIQSLDGQFIWLARDRVTLRDTAAAGLLRKACERIPGAAEDTGRSFAAKGCEGAEPIVVHVVPIRGRGRDLFGSGLVLLAVSRLGQQGAPDASIIQGLFDLTAAEARIAAGLLEGASVPDLSRRHQVSPETVRTQVKSLLAKAGVSRQAEFIAKLRAVSIQR